MKTLTMLARASNNRQLKQAGDLLSIAFEDLNVEVDVLEKEVGRWIQVNVSGEDEGVAASYISKEIGTCPANLNNIEKNSVLKGYISKVDKDKQDLKIDVGVFEPESSIAVLTLDKLREQLFDGHDINLSKISELYGLCEGVPLRIKVVSLPTEENDFIQSELSYEQIQMYLMWKQSLLERLIALGASNSDVGSALERSKLKRDVISVESLGMFEKSLSCKLGTNAAGLIPKIGRYLINSRFIIFNPWKISSFQG